MSDSAASLHTDEPDLMFVPPDYVDTLYLRAENVRATIGEDHNYARIRKALWQADPSCRYCGDYLSSPGKATLEHVMPLSKGGSKRSLHNLTITCGPCNKAKWDRTPREWLERLETQAAVMRKLIELNGL